MINILARQFFSLFHSNGCLWILYQTRDVFSAIVVATYFFAAHPLDLLKTCWCINNLCIWMQTFVNNKLFGSFRWIHLSLIHKFGSMVCLKFAVFSEFLDIEHNPSTLQSFCKPFDPFPIAWLANILFRFMSCTPLDFVDVENPCCDAIYTESKLCSETGTLISFLSQYNYIFTVITYGYFLRLNFKLLNLLLNFSHHFQNHYLHPLYSHF